MTTLLLQTKQLALVGLVKSSNQRKLMNKCLYCEECELEYRIKHDADDISYIPAFCPFCGLERENPDDQFDVEEEADEE